MIPNFVGSFPGILFFSELSSKFIILNLDAGIRQSLIPIEKSELVKKNTQPLYNVLLFGIETVRFSFSIVVGLYANYGDIVSIIPS